MALGIGTLFTAATFTKNKKKIIGIGVLVLVLGLIYGGMKLDAWRIDRLKEDLRTEQAANRANTESLEQSERVRGIDEATLTRLLDERLNIQSSTDETVNKVISDVRRIQREERQDLERRLAALDEKLDRVDEDGDETSTYRPQQILPTPSQSQSKTVSDRIAGTMVDGMYSAYCDAVPNDSLCPQRQPDSDGDG